MAELNPYRPPAAPSDLPGAARPGATRQLWLGYLIAPLVTPVLAAIVIFFGGLLFSDPYDTGTPIGIILLPILLLTVGVIVSYVLALVIGMPIVFLLHRKNALTGYTIHVAAIIVPLLLAVPLTLVSYFVEGHMTLSETALACGLTFLILAPCFLIPTTVFWLIARRATNVANLKELNA